MPENQATIQTYGATANLGPLFDRAEGKVVSFRYTESKDDFIA
jgi:hypothetical protein